MVQALGIVNKPATAAAWVPRRAGVNAIGGDEVVGRRIAGHALRQEPGR